MQESDNQRVHSSYVMGVISIKGLFTGFGETYRAGTETSLAVEGHEQS